MPLWADHVIWTRAYIVAAVSDDPSAQSALDRLIKNQEELGNATHRTVLWRAGSYATYAAV